MSDVRTPPRRLVDLDPKWTGVYGHRDRNGLGLHFRCPCLANDCAWGGTVAVDLANPLDGGPPIPFRGVERQPTLWMRQGETFEVLTLSPSLHLVGHWHGWIRNGEVISC